MRDADLSAFYVDRGVSAGMLLGAEAAGFAGRDYDVRIANDADGTFAAAADRPLRAAWKRGYKARALDDSIVCRDGWKCAAMHDPSGRRGIWYRTEGEPGRPQQLVIGGGRDGDEYVVSLPFQGLGAIYTLKEILEVSRWMIDDHGTRRGADVLDEAPA